MAKPLFENINIVIDHTMQAAASMKNADARGGVLSACADTRREVQAITCRGQQMVEGNISTSSEMCQRAYKMLDRRMGDLAAKIDMTCKLHHTRPNGVKSELAKVISSLESAIKKPEAKKSKGELVAKYASADSNKSLEK